jgi:hypothetical protein
MTKALHTARVAARGKPVPYQIGELYIAALPDLKEVEIEDVLHEAGIIKIKGEGWLDQRTFGDAVKARLGRVVYSSGLLGLKRKIIRDMGGDKA